MHFSADTRSQCDHDAGDCPRRLVRHQPAIGFVSCCCPGAIARPMRAVEGCRLGWLAAIGLAFLSGTGRRRRPVSYVVSASLRQHQHCLGADDALSRRFGVARHLALRRAPQPAADRRPRRQRLLRHAAQLTVPHAPRRRRSTAGKFRRLGYVRRHGWTRTHRLDTRRRAHFRSPERPPLGSRLSRAARRSAIEPVPAADRSEAGTEGPLDAGCRSNSTGWRRRRSSNSASTVSGRRSSGRSRRRRPFQRRPRTVLAARAGDRGRAAGARS